MVADTRTDTKYMQRLMGAHLYIFSGGTLQLVQENCPRSQAGWQNVITFPFISFLSATMNNKQAPLLFHGGMPDQQMPTSRGTNRRDAIRSFKFSQRKEMQPATLVNIAGLKC